MPTPIIIAIAVIISIIITAFIVKSGEKEDINMDLYVSKKDFKYILDQIGHEVHFFGFLPPSVYKKSFSIEDQKANLLDFCLLLKHLNLQIKDTPASREIVKKK